MVEQQQKEFKHLVRIAKTDLDGNKAIVHALRKIKGVSYSLANLTCVLAQVEKTAKAGYLSDEIVNKLSQVLENPAQFGAPEWMFNRRRDPETNESDHLLSTDLTFTVENDVKLMKKIKSYKGLRHGKGLPVRGQRTRSNFRKNKGKVHLGVQRKKVQASTEKKEEKGKEKKK